MSKFSRLFKDRVPAKPMLTLNLTGEAIQQLSELLQQQKFSQNIQLFLQVFQQAPELYLEYTSCPTEIGEKDADTHTKATGGNSDRSRLPHRVPGD